MLKDLGLSERHSCHLAGAARSTIRYKSVRPQETELRQRMHELADRHRRFGHPRLHVLLRREGFGANHKKTHRLYVEEGLQVRKRKKRRRSAIARRPMVLPSRPGQRWSMDFMSDQLSSGRRIRLFNVIDDYTRQCLAIVVDVSINGRRVARELTRLIDLYGRPEFIVCDNGTEYTSLVMFDWAQRSASDCNLFNPGSQVKTASVNRLMDGCATSA